MQSTDEEDDGDDEEEEDNFLAPGKDIWTPDGDVPSRTSPARGGDSRRRTPLEEVLHRGKDPHVHKFMFVILVTSSRRCFTKMCTTRHTFMFVMPLVHLSFLAGLLAGTCFWFLFLPS